MLCSELLESRVPVHLLLPTITEAFMNLGDRLDVTNINYHNHQCCQILDD